HRHVNSASQPSKFQILPPPLFAERRATSRGARGLTTHGPEPSGPRPHEYRSVAAQFRPCGPEVGEKVVSPHDGTAAVGLRLPCRAMSRRLLALTLAAVGALVAARRGSGHGSPSTS